MYPKKKYWYEKMYFIGKHKNIFYTNWYYILGIWPQNVSDLKGELTHFQNDYIFAMV